MNKFSLYFFSLTVTTVLWGQVSQTTDTIPRTEVLNNFTENSLRAQRDYFQRLRFNKTFVDFSTLSNVAFYNTYVIKTMPENLITPQLCFHADSSIVVKYFFREREIALRTWDSINGFKLRVFTAVHCGFPKFFHFNDKDFSGVEIYFSNDTLDALNANAKLIQGAWSCYHPVELNVLKLCEYNSDMDSVSYKEFRHDGQLIRSGSYYKYSLTRDTVLSINPLTLEEMQTIQTKTVYRKTNDWKIYPTK